MTFPSLVRSFLFLAFVAAGGRISAEAPSPNTVLFLCPHGGAKSVIAASYFNRLAKERGLTLTGVAAATEEPYDVVPPAVAASLAQEGIDVSNFRPRRVAREDVAQALRIVAIDCDVAATDTSPLVPERWDDVPKVSENLSGSMDAIREHVATLVLQMAEPPLDRSVTVSPAADESDWLNSSRTCTRP